MIIMTPKETKMHPTILKIQQIVSKGDEEAIKEILSQEVKFKPPTYYKTWTGREPVAAVLGHVGKIFHEFEYTRIMGSNNDWALEFKCKIGNLDIVGVDLITLNKEGLIDLFEVTMRPLKSISALREAINVRVMKDPRFLNFKSALS
jgi:hypothetical protein